MISRIKCKNHVIKDMRNMYNTEFKDFKVLKY